jgi:ergothioneine biosynthesis protein EgtB
MLPVEALQETAVGARDRRAALAARLERVRAATLALCAPLSPEDAVVQSMPDASPAKWHLAHTTWFFETFVLAGLRPDREPFHPGYSFLFNSYYENLGARHARPARGLITRPSLEEVREYRRAIEGELARWLAGAARRGDGALLDVLELGLAHEEQHQELLVTDLKHLLSCNPLEPVYRPAPAPRAGRAPDLEWTRYAAGLRTLGHRGDGFAFDNEGPAHAVHVAAFELASRPATCGEYLEFVEAGGYSDARWWLSDGWQWVCEQSVAAPAYWRRESGGWSLFTLAGRRALDPAEPLAHVSYYEADAYARFRGARLPREAEWETAAAGLAPEGHFADSLALHPRPVRGDGSAPVALFGDVWEWTQSPYTAYPGYRAAEGALGEYNGKFMANQMVLRGGSCATPPGHVRATYRNFFPPTARWQFSGLRLARDA